jgi:hypothetical protein
MYQPLAFSTLRFTARFVDPSPAAIFAESRGIARIMAAPMNAFPADLLGALELIGGRSVLPHLATTAVASQLKAIAASKRFPEVLRLTDPRIDDDDEEVFRYDSWAAWRRRAVTTGLRTLWDLVSGTDVLTRIRVCATAVFARELVPHFVTRHTFTILVDRINHTLPGIDSDTVQFYVHLRLSGLTRARLPRTIVYSLLRCWCNAVPTARRLQLSSSSVPSGAARPVAMTFATSLSVLLCSSPPRAFSARPTSGPRAPASARWLS